MANVRLPCPHLTVNLDRPLKLAATIFPPHQFSISRPLPFLPFGTEFKCGAGRLPPCTPPPPPRQLSLAEGAPVCVSQPSKKGYVCRLPRAPQLWTYWLTLWYSLAMPWWVQSFPRVGKMCPRVSDLNKDRE